MRDKLDRYYTPKWVIEALLMHLKGCDWPDAGRVLEPCCGDGRLAHALCEAGYHVTTNDLDPDVSAHTHHDFRMWALLCQPRFDMIVTNPPYRRVTEYVRQALAHADHVALLMPLNWLEPCKERADILISQPPSEVLVLPRPSFSTNGKTDARTVAWYIWTKRAGLPTFAHVHPRVRDSARADHDRRQHHHTDH